jgi:hypothetical protein
MDVQSGQAAGGLVPSNAFVERRHASTAHAVFVVVPWRRFFVIDGLGEPMSADFAMAASALRATLGECERVLRRERLLGPSQRAVAETIWWPPSDAGVGEIPDKLLDRADWHWRQLLEIPESATDVHVAHAMDPGRDEATVGMGLVRQLAFTEGPVAQWLHIGDPNGERTSVRRLFEAIAEAGYQPVGPLHVLALVDPGTVPRDRGRSIFRQPIA